MNKKVLMAVVVFLLILVCGCLALNSGKKEVIDDNKITITTTTFSTYDFVRQIVGDKANVIYLLGPGVDAHSYEPSGADLKKIQSADMFIYIGGEMEKWTEKLMNSDVLNTDNTVVIKVSDAVQTIEEMEVDGAEEHEHDHEEEEHEGKEHDGEEHEHEEGAFDEHIWTSPTNAIQMLNYLCKKISAIDKDNQAYYEANAKGYENKIVQLRSQIQAIVNQKKRNRLVFGDKMPMQYFLNEFGLTASAAFNGCSTETEPSSKTIAYLVEKVKEEKIPVVFYIELSTGKTAKAIAGEANIKAAQIQTLHNISKQDFDKGETYVSLMTRNLSVIKEALQ